MAKIMLVVFFILDMLFNLNNFLGRNPTSNIDF